MAFFVRSYTREEKGGTAVEFSLIALPFVFLIIGTIEVALMFTAQSVLQESTFTASRLIRTGQLQQGMGGDPEEAFRDSVCDFSELLIPCDQIQFDVKTLPSFADAREDPPVFDENGNLLGTEFTIGGANDIVMIRVTYNFPIRTPMMQPILANVGGTRRALMSTIVLRTEPYE
jgi:Flp pilus assembly protein TadG